MLPLWLFSVCNRHRVRILLVWCILRNRRKLLAAYKLFWWRRKLLRFRVIVRVRLARRWAIVLVPLVIGRPTFMRLRYVKRRLRVCPFIRLTLCRKALGPLRGCPVRMMRLVLIPVGVFVSRLALVRTRTKLRRTIVRVSKDALGRRVVTVIIIMNWVVARSSMTCRQMCRLRGLASSLGTNVVRLVLKRLPSVVRRYRLMRGLRPLRKVLLNSCGILIRPIRMAMGLWWIRVG